MFAAESFTSPAEVLVSDTEPARTALITPDSTLKAELAVSVPEPVMLPE
jgi:hypothetical protein